LKTLQEVTLPLEQMELDLAAEQSKRAVLQAQRDDEGRRIDRQIAVETAEAELTRLEDELAELGSAPEALPVTAVSQPATHADAP